MDNENPITDEIDETEVQDGGEAGNEDRQEQAEAEGGAAESAEEPGDGDRGRKQTHELNAAAKAARKQAERETEERMRKKFDEEIAATGIPNPYTGKPFGSWKEFQDYSKRLAAQKRAELQEQADAKKREDERRAFIMADAKAFMEKFPKVDLQKLDENTKFRRFCGKRYGVEPLADLYQDYLDLVGSVAAETAAKASSRNARGAGNGTGSTGGGLTAEQRETLEAWNRNNPELKMTEKEFLER